tara:strand:- start:1317 stop:1721 length:405 start_codon:yes stop_codon:yes gene_type:complete
MDQTLGQDMVGTTDQIIEVEIMAQVIEETVNQVTKVKTIDQGQNMVEMTDQIIIEIADQTTVEIIQEMMTDQDLVETINQAMVRIRIIIIIDQKEKEMIDQDLVEEMIEDQTVLKAEDLVIQEDNLFLSSTKNL